MQLTLEESFKIENLFLVHLTILAPQNARSEKNLIV